MKDTLDKVLRKIKPSRKQEEEIKRKVDTFLKRINMRISATVTVGGSFAKQSYLKDIKDIDIFVIYERGSKDISKNLGSVLKKMFPDVKELHGSRDYFQVEHEGLIFEVVPIIRIEDPDDAENITDISPFHVKWVTKKTKNPDEIRLSKAFAKAIGAYGAESYIQGFSGYTLEILTIFYGGFIKLLKSASEWKKPTIIDPERYHKDVFTEVNDSKLNSPLIVIDPVQAGRNTSASLSDEKFELFRKKAGEFLRHPSAGFFDEKTVTPDLLKRRAGKNSLILLRVKNFDGKEDVEGCRILKVFEYIAKKFEYHDFKLLENGWSWDKKSKALLWYIIVPERLSESITRRGPPVRAKKNVLQFKEKHSDSFVKGGRLYAKVARQYKDPSSLVKDLLKDEYIEERVESIRILS